MKEVTVFARAKVNLALAITGKRADGYHTIESVMHSISLCDKLTVRLTEGPVSLTCSDENVPTDDRNTAVRAAKAFLSRAGTECGAEITLEKCVPYEAGLGSASADAAGVLRALSYLTGDPLGEEEMLDIALSVGADVPFCMSGGAKLARGIGEELTDLPALENGAFLVIKPACSVSTPAAYKAFDDLTAPPEIDVQAMCRAMESNDLAAVGKSMANAFLACPLPEDIRTLIDGLLANGALGAVMSGSGSAVFGLFPDRASAEAALCRIAHEGCFAAVAEPENCSVVFAAE